MGYSTDTMQVKPPAEDLGDFSNNTSSSETYDDLFLKALAQVVREHRELIGMSQEDLASEAKLHRTYVSDIERGVRNFSVKTLNRIARSFEVSAGHILNLAEERTQQLISQSPI